MKMLRATVCVLLCVCMLLPAAACGGGGGYRIIDTYSGEGNYVIAFRQGDRLGEYVTAALQELAANGTLRTASLSWFGENLTSLRGQEGAIADLWEDRPIRTVTVGIDVTNMPMSYPASDGTYQGFDVDLASYICGYLGWSMVLYPIDQANVQAELNSGNIDMAMGVPENDQTSGFDYSPAYLTSQYVLVTRSSGHIRRRNGMKNKTLGVSITDLDVLQQDEKFVENLGAIIYQTNTDGLFQALMKGEVDGILVSSVVASYYMK